MKSDKVQALWGTQHLTHGVSLCFRRLRQTQDREQRLIDEAREMAKPLARHVDDVELNTVRRTVSG